MMEAVGIRSYAPPPIDRREILRYAGVRQDTDELDALIDECLSLLSGQCAFRVCFREFPIAHEENALNLGFIKTASRDLMRCLDGCESVLLFAATVGLALDRLVLRYGKTEPSKGLLLQAIGAERIESLCNLFFTDIAEEKKKEGCLLRPRFSAGYGDFPLEAQRDIFRALDCPKSIGLTLNAGLLMSPTKSVTALVGVAKQK